MPLHYNKSFKNTIFYGGGGSSSLCRQDKGITTFDDAVKLSQPDTEAIPSFQLRSTKVKGRR